MTTKRRKRHTPEQIVRKLRDAEAMLNAGKDQAAVLQSLEVSQTTFDRWRNQYGGIDGRGIARIHGLMSFHVLFQCKRYTKTVSPSDIRDFRGAMIGRADKGLFITTGSFTREAMREATRDGAPPIDLLDGDELIEKLKQLQLGVRTETIEVVTIQHDWFESLNTK